MIQICAFLNFILPKLFNFSEISNANQFDGWKIFQKFLLKK